MFTSTSGRKARTTSIVAALVLVAYAAVAPRAQNRNAGKVTSPKEQFGWDIGDDYRLVNYTQYEQYLKKLDQESDRLTVIDIGKTAEGRTEWTAIVTSPENHKNLARYKDINRRLALAEGLTDDQARQLARDGKMVVWIDGGLHATEVLGAQQLIETAYRLVSRTDPETTRILNDDIVLLTLVNPDGMELVSNWYMRNADERQRSTNGIPRLYQKYIGHDNNRDFYMMNQPESENANRIMYREWFPAIMYNHHQTGPAGAVLFAPPFRDPFNYHFDPLIPLGIDMVGAAIHTRLAVENKPGAVMRSGASYSTWFNGGIRTTSYFHNQIGILTETIGNPTPIEIPFVPDMQLPRGDVPNPIAPQRWHFRQSIEYSLTNNYAILDLASKRKEDFLFNMYKMGKNAIERGSRDHWTMHPRRIEAVRAAMRRGGVGAAAAGAPRRRRSTRTMLRNPAMRDPRGFILPSDQPDFLTATKFVNILIKGGVTVHRATAPFAVNGKQYPAGSYVVKTAQAFRPHVMDMFEPQDHPDDIPYPGGAPRPPYDVTGYNLAYSMGIKYDRILDAFDGPFEKLADVVPPPPGIVTQAPSGGGYLLSHEVNDAFVAVNRLLKANEEVHWLKAAVDAERAVLSGGHHVHSCEADDAADSAEAGRGQRPEVRGGGRRAQRGDDEAAAGAHRPVGRLRRLDALWLDALVARAVRVPIRGRLRQDPRCRQSRRQVRRADLRGWRHSRTRRRRRRPAASRHHSRRVPRLAGQRQRVADRSRTEEIRRGRRNDSGDRFIDGAGTSPWAADSKRADGARRRRRSTAGGREVLRARLDPAGPRGQYASAGLRSRQHGRHLLRPQRGVPPAAGGGVEGLEGGCLD